jgi:tol-pal system protein YbgF
MSMTSLTTLRASVLALLASLSLGAQAAIFADNEAREEIIKLRPQVENLRRSLAAMSEDLRKSEEVRRNLEALQARHLEVQARQLEAEQTLQRTLAKSADDQAQLRRGMLELANQIEALRRELTQLRGENEQLVHFVAGVQRGLQDMKRGQSDLQMGIDGMRTNLTEMQRSVKEVSSGVDERIRRIEPLKVSVDGREFDALPAEVAAFDAALGIMRRGEYPAARAAFEQFQARYPTSGYRSSVLFWLGNAQYATQDYKDALASFRRMLQIAPDHQRAAEAMLAVANCQLELKEPRPVVRRSLEDLVKSFPNSEAAAAARDRLSKLK